jgi:uncharacterized protein YndB with AHSA1/START domain
MGVPTSGSATITIDARPEAVYDLVADVTRMGEWSPECVSCEWLDTPGAEGSRFRGRNRNGPARWTTTAKVLRADRGREFTFATLHKDDVSTRWTYRFEGDETTTLTESFEAVRIPFLIALLERTITRKRQEELEAGLRATLERLKVVAESANGPA